MTSTLRSGQLVKGKLGAYTVIEQLHKSIWLAVNQDGERVVIKSVRRFRIHNKCDIFKRFQARTPSLCRLVDEIIDPSGPPALVLKLLDDDLLHASAAKKLIRPEVQYVMRKVLEALALLHEDGYVHTNPSCSLVPLVLDDDFLSRNSSVPELAVVGFPGAYWPLFEMQARATVLAWNSSSSSQITSTEADLVRRHRLREYFRVLRRAVKEGKKGEILHNPFGDVVSALEQAYRQLDLDRFDLGFSELGGFVCSARFLDPGNDKCEAMKTLLEIQAVRKTGKDGDFLARAVMRGLLGEWVAAGKNTYGRIEIIEPLFIPRFPTDTGFNWEHLVIRTENSRIIRNVYRYSEITDHITVWNVSEDELSTGTLQSMFQFKHPQQEHGRDTAVTVLVSTFDTMQMVDGLAVFRFHFAGSSLKT